MCIRDSFGSQQWCRIICVLDTLLYIKAHSDRNVPFLIVGSARALSNGCKSRVSPNSGTYIAKGKGVHREVIQRVVEPLRSLLIIPMLVTTWLTSWTLTATFMTLITTTATLTALRPWRCVYETDIYLIKITWGTLVSPSFHWTLQNYKYFCD